MRNKIKAISIIVISIIALLISYVISYANNGSIYVNLQKTNQNGIGYGMGSPTNYGDYIWDIRTYDTQGNLSNNQRNLYCIKGNYSETWNNKEATNPQETIVEYNLSYDLQKDRMKLITLLGNGNEANGVVTDLLDANKYYRELLWVLDNIYDKNTQEKARYLEKIYDAKYTYDETGEYVPHCFDWEDEITIGHYNINRLEVNNLLTDDDIKAVEKAVIWYFTNYKTSEEESFNKEGKTDWITITEDGGVTYKQIADISEEREIQIQLLYKGLITKATANASKYTEENGYQTKVSAEIDKTKLTLNGENYILNTKRVGTNNIVGPIVIKNGSYSTIKTKITNEKGVEVEYKLVDKNGTQLTSQKIEEQVGKTEGFYISVDRNIATEVNVEIKIKDTRTVKTLWLSGLETDQAISLNAEQPLVEVETKEEEITTKLKATPDEFDLALRKYITEINGEIVNNTRIPNISETTLQEGTTATYKHRKDPVIVKEGDTVTYKLTIYNEGNKAGYATKIIDQLPDGLISSTENGTTVTSKGKDGTDKNTYDITYNTTTNRITLSITGNPKELNAYEEGKLDYETITIKCKVVEKADTKKQKILTNVAWIDGAYDVVSQKEATDRDSQPKTAPNVNKSNMENYKGNTENKSELGDEKNYYKGEQDDDDFEKLVIMPETKIFDLALFKHIAAISDDQTIENGEYITDTGNIDGIYLRAPVVEAIENGKVKYKEDEKEALSVEEGDYVLYTIRVYNEGEVAGYASKIKDTLPIGLEFVTDNEEYNGIWNLEGLDEDGRQVVTTTWYAKGQGAELNSVEGDDNYKANLLKALQPDSAISEENPDYLDAQILCKVVEKSTSNRVLVNYAQISEDSDENGDPIDDIDSTPDKWIEGEDDQDIERIKLQCFDLSLRKFITKINDSKLTEKDGTYIREPKVDVTDLEKGDSTTAEYNHSKQPVSVQVGDKVTYTIRVYNEGDIDGYASKVTDYLPPHLEYIEESETNKKYDWEVSEDGRKVTTTYLEGKKLTAFKGEKLDYEDIQIECKVAETAPTKQNITNIAEISEYKYNESVINKDIDSTADNMESAGYLPEDKDLPSYKNNEMSKDYIPGNEDDDDFEKIYIKEFDLALKKFITQVQEREVTDREPQAQIENNKITYKEHSKDPLVVHVEDTVIYTLRIYNEGEISGYAKVVSDDIPEHLEYLPEHSINTEYMWKMYKENGEETENASEAVKVKTEYLSKENGEKNLINAFDGNTLDYKDIKIAFKVKDPNSNTTVITNHAQISDDTDEKGNPVKDKDSEPDKWIEGEDDQDIENIKVEYFDLALLKFVTKVIVEEDGNQKITETGYNGLEDPEPVVKVELHRKKISDVKVKFGYGITITNEGDIPGYATEITDYVPEGLIFDSADNPNWKDEGNNVISTKQLEGKLLQPGESVTIEVILTWVNSENNLSLKTNTAEISEDKNEYDVPDRDSTPDNKVEGEDDIDIAKVILSISTGAVKTYFTLTLGLLAIITIGIILIRKYVI